MIKLPKWWNNSEPAEKLNWLIGKNYARIVTKDDELVGVELFKVTEIRREGGYIRAASEDDGVTYFKHYFYKPILDFVKPEEWFLTNERDNDDDNCKSRLLVGRMSNGKYVLLAPVKGDPYITERFEK